MSPKHTYRLETSPHGNSNSDGRRNSVCFTSSSPNHNLTRNPNPEKKRNPSTDRTTYPPTPTKTRQSTNDPTTHSSKPEKTTPYLSLYQKKGKPISTLKWGSFEGVSNECPLPKTRYKRRLSERQGMARGERERSCVDVGGIKAIWRLTLQAAAAKPGGMSEREKEKRKGERTWN
jgi:hypothetical protein